MRHGRQPTYIIEYRFILIHALTKKGDTALAKSAQSFFNLRRLLAHGKRIVPGLKVFAEQVRNFMGENVNLGFVKPTSLRQFALRATSLGAHTGMGIVQCGY